MRITFEEFVRERKIEGFRHIATSDFLGLLHLIVENKPDEFIGSMNASKVLMGYSESTIVNYYRISICCMGAYTSYIAIMHGLSSNQAFDIADYYIYLSNETDNPEELKKIFEEETHAYCTLFNSSNKIHRYNPLISKILDYISQNLFQQIRISKIAKKVNRTPSYISKIFKKEVGITINDYINCYRIREAFFMTFGTNKKLTEIAVSVGFTDLSHFDKICKKYTGTTPKNLSFEVIEMLPINQYSISY